MSKSNAPFEPPLSAASGQRSSADVLMLYQGETPHPAHRVFGDGVDATYRHFETGAECGAGENQGSIAARLQQGRRLERHDVVIAEGSAPLMTLAAYKARHPSTTALYLAADEFFYTLPQRQSRHLWRGIGPVVGRALDGCIAVGRDAYNWAQRYLGEIPCEIVRPPISDTKYDRLSSLTPQSPQEPFTVLTAGNAQPSKRIDRVIDAVERLRDDGVGARATILGDGHLEEDYASHPATEVPGFVDLDRFASHFERASVYVQASEGDSFPVASLEGMLSGTPTVVSHAVGTRELVPDELVAATSGAGLYERLDWLRTQSTATRRQLGTELREQVAQFTETRQQRRFQEAVQEVAT